MATLDDVRKLQKRARDKEYRLRTQGADQANIDKVSPRVGWGEVKGMSKAQLNTYAKQLDRFNKKARYVGSESGDVIPTKYIDQVTRMVKEQNKFVRRETKRIKGLAPDLWNQYRASQQGVLAREEAVGGLLTPVDPRKLERPRSLNVAKRRVKSYKKMRKHDFDFYRRIQRKNMVSMLQTLNQYDLAELVRNMSADRFDVLSSILPTWDLLSIEYYDPSSQSAAYEDVRAYVYKAHALNRKTPESKIIDNLERNREARQRRGAERAEG